MLGYWGMESAFGDVVTNPRHMKPVFNSLSRPSPGAIRAGANIGRPSFSTRSSSWSAAGARRRRWSALGRRHGHTQWMPEVWLKLAWTMTATAASRPSASRTMRWPAPPISSSSAAATERRALGDRGPLPAGFNTQLADNKTWRPLSAWGGMGLTMVEGQSITEYDNPARLWLPGGAGGPRCCCSIISMRCAPTIPPPPMRWRWCMGRRVMGGEPFRTPWPAVSAPDAGRIAGDPAAPHPPRLRHRRDRRAGGQ